MPTGQQVLETSVLDVAELDRIGARIEARELERSARHADQLADALALSRTLADAGMELSAGPQLALFLQCSENRAEMLLHDARVLQRLHALDPMRAGALTVEQSRVVVDVLGPLDDDLAASLWERTRTQLAQDRHDAVVRPPARLRELVQRWILEADPEGAVARRKQAAEIHADVEIWTRDDGLVDLAGRALSPADAIACRERIDELAQPLGPGDERSLGQRRQSVFTDLLLGRTALPFDAETGEMTTGCCPPGSAAPCGAQVFVHVPLDAALQESTQPAELIGHGPIDAAALRDLLLAEPVLHLVWTDSNGVPIAVDDRTWRPGRDPASLRQALQDMRAGPPPERRHPVHPDDHPPGQPPQSPLSSSLRTLQRPHLADPGPYRPSKRQQRLLRARAPRCEWPGCGRRASRAVAPGCDLDHDLAWPYGPTCACNLGPLCRRHHRIKQLGWIKHRRADGSIRWTSTTGRTWTSPSQHARTRRPNPIPARRRVAPGVWALAA